MGRSARDHTLIDAIDAFARTPFSGDVWRVVRDGRDPVLGSPSMSRWCNGGFDVLYTCLDRVGAVAEVHAFLSLQPVFPSKPLWRAHRLAVAASETLRLADFPTLERLGVDVSRYHERDYRRTQEIADVANFLGFDGLLAPSARWAATNAMLFTERIDPDRITCVESDPDPVDWAAVKRRREPAEPSARS